MIVTGSSTGTWDRYLRSGYESSSFNYLSFVPLNSLTESFLTTVQHDKRELQRSYSSDVTVHTGNKMLRKVFLSVDHQN